MDPEKEYQSRLAHWSERAAFFEQRHRRVGSARIWSVVALVALALFFVQSLTVGVVIAVILVGLFLSGMVHDRILKRRDAARRAVAYYQAGLDRLAGRWEGKGTPGTDFLDKEHPYAIDIDLFGRGSVFELINSAQTQSGRARLAGWLRQRTARDEILARQTAVAELRPGVDLREDVAVLAADAQSHIDTLELISWGNRPPVPVSSVLRIVVFCLPLVTWSFFIFGKLEIFVAAMAAQLALAHNLRPRVREALESLRTPSANLVWLSQLFARLQREKFVALRLSQLHDGWQTGGVAAGESLRQLAGLVDWVDSRQNQLFAAVGRPLLLETQIALAVEAWHARYGARIENWLEQLGEMEALSSLGRHAYEHPGDPFPELLAESSPARITAAGLGHPLLPEAKAVRNDVALDSNHRLIIISGSNMSGKSTLLRALGVNLALGMAGAPVRAQKLAFTPLQISASIRTVDSLHEGTSRFYAEITRLRQIVDLTAKPDPVLFLLDELLSGTNSHDRRIGAGFILKNLIDRNAVGLITTHDLALTQIADELQPRALNCHFEDQINGGRMSFDYQLRPGIVEKSNALELMRSIGLVVAPDSPERDSTVNK